MKKQTENLTMLQAFYSDFEANLALTKLHANDIWATLSNELTSQVLAVPIADYCQIRLWVRNEDKDRARAILASDPDFGIADPDGDEDF